MIRIIFRNISLFSDIVLDGPICIIHGTEDSIVPYSYGVRFSEGNDNAVVHLIEGDDHAFSRHIDEAAAMAVGFLSGINR